MKLRWVVVFALSVLLHFYNAPARAQASSRVTGTVQDTSGAIVPDAVVTLINEATNISVETKTTSSGTYVFDGIVPGTYTVAIAVTGFSNFTATGNRLTIAQPMVVNATLKIGETSEKVVVSAGAELVQTENSGDLGALVDQRALETLPVVGSRGRSPLDLLEVSVPGVIDGGPLNSTGANIEGGGVSVNGSRDRAWNFTLDGIDINETSAPGSNFSPLRTNPDSIEGFRVITTNANAEYGVTSGAQVILETHPGTNEFHGKLFWFYQTPGLNANDPANKENLTNGQPIPRPQFVQHIPGFSVGGPIFKNRTFFFVNTQLLHASQDFLVNSLVYTQPARMGLFRYLQQQGACIGSTSSSCPHNDNAAASDAVVDGSGNPLPGLPIGTYDINANDPAHLGLDGSIQKFIGLTPLPNNFNIGDGLNTAGFRFQAPEQERQVDFTVRIDHQFNSKNSIFGRWAHGHQNTIGDIGNGGLRPFPNAPNIVDTDRQPRNLAISWRYTPNSHVTNEVIAGMNRFIFNFVNPDSTYLNNPSFVFFGDAVSGSNLASPLQNYVGNKRALTSIQLVDNLSYIRGTHAFKFGTNLRYQRHIDDRGSIGPYDAQPLTFFNPGFASVDSRAFNIPADVNGSIDVTTLDNAVNNLLGRISNIQQGFVAQNANQYAPAGSHLRDDFRMPEYDFYAQDSWKVRSNLTVNIGLRWEIKLSPRVGSNFLLHPNQAFTVDAPPSDTLTWVPGNLYKDAWKNFAPSIGIAWDPFKNGKQSIRADYRLAYDRMNTFVLSASIFQGIPGEALPINSTAVAGQRVSSGIPVLTPPPGQTPVSLRQPAAFSTTSITAIDPNWTPPQVHEWSLSVQRQISHDTLFEIAYVGKHAVHLFGGYDSNQVQIRNNGFLDAFKNIYGPFAANGVPGDSPLIDQLVANDPGFQAVVQGGASATGSQYVAGNCVQADMSNPCSGSAYASDFGHGSVAAVAAALGSISSASGTSLPVAAGLPSTFLFKYPQFSGQTASPGFIVFDSGDWSWYNGLQASYHGRFHGVQFQTNYTWSKSMDTRSFDPTFGTVIGGSSTFGSSSTPFDNENRRRNYAPSDIDRTHVFQAIWTYQIPTGAGRRWGGSWSPAVDRLLGGWEIAGSTVVESGRPSTIYSPAYTTSDIVRTPASCNGCTHDMLHVHFNPDTAGLNYLTTAQMKMFFTPGPGEFSNIGRNFFRLGRYSVVNLSVGKVTHITERH
ncbi:MAG: TonB-dependent receptor, partial [Acidobacteriota bacterium]|nr:TonB-dependent receptor [Acidobacteriota bacterium]